MKLSCAGYWALSLVLSAAYGAESSGNSSSQVAADSVMVAPSDENFLYIGRWDRSDPTLARGYWNGHYLRCRFTGTSVRAKFKTGDGLLVSIDGEPFRLLSGGSKLTALHDKPLKNQTHTLQLGSSGQNQEVNFEGLVLDPGAKTLPVTPRPIIEFVGDSITTGTAGNYAWSAAEMLGCDHVQIAFSGVALTDGYGCTSTIGQETQYFQLKNYNHNKEPAHQAWDFSYTPAIIVINLGQNDQCGRAPAETVREAYIRFIEKIRGRFPKSRLVMMRTFGGPYEKSIREAWEIVSKKDPLISHVDTTGWLTKEDFADGIHPNPTGHMKAGHRLANHLETLLVENKP